MKRLLVIAFLLFSYIGWGQTILIVKVNNKYSRSITIKPEGNTYTIKASDIKTVNAVSIKLNGMEDGPAFKKTLSVTDIKDSLVSHYGPLKSNEFIQLINIAEIKKIYKRFKVLKVYLDSDPANPMMRMRSRRKLILTLNLK